MTLSSRKVNVFLTVDTEIMYNFLSDNDMDRSIEISIYGRGKGESYGLEQIIEILNEYGLKASFFVEPLFSFVNGPDDLQKIIEFIRKNGHEVQLHIHPEWLTRMTEPFVAPGSRYLKDFSLEEQTLLISEGLKRLKECGANDICCFRAGHYAANFDTIRALNENRIPFDTSYNACYLKECCDMDTGSQLLQPERLGGVWEIPIGFFADWRNHCRHTQVTACSFLELKNFLQSAWQSGFFSAVIVFHSFELINRFKDVRQEVSVDRFMLKRFRFLCRFLSENRDKFRATGFSNIDSTLIPALTQVKPFGSNPIVTGMRYLEQFLRRFQP